MANKNRVYVNPNFQKLLPTTVPSSSANHSKIIMHINPNFSKPISSNQSKIYVNPNFLNTTNCRSYEIRPASATTANLNYQINVAPVNTQSDKRLEQQFISKTRYALVRQNNTQPSPCNVSEKITATVKINKYKTVAIKKFKKNLEAPTDLKITKQSAMVCNSLSAKPTDSTSTLSEVKKSAKFTLARPRQFYKNKYKLCKPSAVKSGAKPITLNRSYLMNRNWRNIKLKVARKTLKKNNIPCPLYKKYGKCLRSVNGICEFSHDKRHVSICRKFLKGICQENTCLLSHDVSAKKMPTCYFYLQGVCTKDDCPYLHVKLNDKSKICQEFLRGYCERGDKCTHRHILIDSYKQNKKAACKSRSSTIIIKRKSANVEKSKRLNKNLQTISNESDDNKVQNSEPSTSECRYYSEVITKSGDSSTHEAIKPSRCKLGTLPSYIKL